MNKNKNILASVLSLITYKEKNPPKKFILPEINEQNVSKKDTGEKAVQPDNSMPSGRSRAKIVRKPIPAGQLKKDVKAQDSNEQDKKDLNIAISTNIDVNIDFIRKQFNYPVNSDIIIREFLVAGKYRAFIANLNGMVDKATVNNFILRPLLDEVKFKDKEEGCQLDYILNNVIETNQADKVTKPDDVVVRILSGDTGIYVDGSDFYILCETKGYDKRRVEKPHVEGVVKGSQEGFTENLRTNIALVRRVIKNKDLTTELMNIGERNHSQCALIYINGLINPAIVGEVKRRISSLKSDFIHGDGILEQLIEDNPWSFVPTILSTERPERAASHIVEGKVAIIAEGTPFALIVPITLATLLHSSEDTSLRWQYGTLLRLIRMFAVIVATLLPGFYVALTNFHREMIPTDLLIAIAKARENVPFPTIFEVLLMEVSFELIREAGVRVPGIIGNTIGIIGALIIGQASVQANLVSPVLIIVIAFTGLGNFAIPDFSVAFGARIMRLFYIILGASFGFFGISLGIIVFWTFLINLKSFGVPMLTFLAPKTRRSNDLFLILPNWKQEFRPDDVNPLDVRRQPRISRKWTQENAYTLKSREKKEKQDD